MSCIVYQTDKRTGIKYAYESFSYWDKDKQQPRSKRKYIGRVDPETNEIIHTDKKVKKANVSSAKDQKELSRLYDEILSKDQEISVLQKRISKLEKRCSVLSEAIRKIGSIAEDNYSV